MKVFRFSRMPFKLAPTYISAGCNRSPNCLAWRGDVLLYASANSVVVASRSESASSTLEARATFCGHEGRVNCVRWLEGGTRAGTDLFFTASADGTSAVWRRRSNLQFERTRKLCGHTRAVTLVSAVSITEDQSRLLIATASADCSIRLWKVDDSSNKSDSAAEAASVLDLGRGLCTDIRLAAIDTTSALMFAATEDCAVRIYSGSIDSGVFELRHALKGHEDWVRSLDVARTDGGDKLWLASGGQDGFVRVWKMSPEKGSASRHWPRRMAAGI